MRTADSDRGRGRRRLRRRNRELAQGCVKLQVRRPGSQPFDLAEEAWVERSNRTQDEEMSASGSALETTSRLRISVASRRAATPSRTAIRNQDVRNFGAGPEATPAPRDRAMAWVIPPMPPGPCRTHLSGATG